MYAVIEQQNIRTFLNMKQNVNDDKTHLHEFREKVQMCCMSQCKPEDLSSIIIFSIDFQLFKMTLAELF